MKHPANIKINTHTILLCLPLGLLIIASKGFSALREEAISAIVNIMSGLYVLALSSAFAARAPASVSPMPAPSATPEMREASSLKVSIRLQIAFLVSLFMISQFVDAMLIVISKLEHSHLLSFTDQGYTTLQIYLIGWLACGMMVPILTMVSFSLGRDGIRPSYWLFLVSTVAAGVEWVAFNHVMGNDTGFGDPAALRGVLKSAPLLGTITQSITFLVSSALFAGYEWLISRLGNYFPR